MKARSFFIVALFLMYQSSHALFTYDRVATLMQKGEFDKAMPLLQKMVVDSPENPEVLYDAGVASYKTKEFTQAAAYFKQAASKLSATQALQEKAYFNSANAAVELKQLESAIADYEAVLKINPDNQRAQHNLEKVKEMLNKKQEQQQDQQDKKDDQKKDEEKKDKQDQKQDQQNKNDSEQEKKEKEESEQDKQSEDQKQDQKNDQQQKQDQNEKNKEQQEQQQKDEAQKQADEQKKREEEQKQEKAAQDKQKQEEAAQQKQAKEDKESKDQQAKTAQEQAQENGMQKMAPYLAKILDEQDKKDAALHKMMVKQAVNNNMAGHNGQNNW